MITNSLATFNIDLIIDGITAASMAVLGFTALASGTHNKTNQAFFFFTIFGTVWGVLNYMFYHVGDPHTAFLIIRAVIFVGVWFVLFLFHFLYVFPKKSFKYPNWYRFFVIPFSAIVSIITLTPLVFNHVSEVSSDGTILSIENGKGIFLFVATITALVFGGLLLFIHKMQRAPVATRGKYKSVLWGVFFTFVFIITFNLILPAFFNNSEFVIYGPVFMLPIVFGAAYAIRVHHLFNIKVFSTALLVFLLASVSFGEIVVSSTSSLVLFHDAVFVLVLIFGINLTREVVLEVEQRENIQKLVGTLEETNKRQEALIHFVSHEVKGYLAKDMSVFSNLIEGDMGELPDEAKPFISEALSQTRAGASSVMRILQASNLKNGKVLFNMKQFDFAELVKKTSEEMRLDIERKGLKFVVLIKKETEPYTVYGDADKLVHVIRNVIENAISYTPEGSITVSLDKDENGEIILNVQDTGIGITDEDKKYLFTEGGHGKDSIKINAHSTGYGLFIAKQIIDAHKGTIHVESGGDGRGTLFSINLPYFKKVT